MVNTQIFILYAQLFVAIISASLINTFLKHCGLEIVGRQQNKVIL